MYKAPVKPEHLSELQPAALRFCHRRQLESQHSRRNRGAVLGGIAGNMVEKGITNQTGVEYTVRTNNGETITLVQGTSPTFAVGQKVLIVYGKEARIIADTAQ